MWIAKFKLKTKQKRNKNSRSARQKVATAVMTYTNQNLIILISLPILVICKKARKIINKKLTFFSFPRDYLEKSRPNIVLSGKNQF